MILLSNNVQCTLEHLRIQTFGSARGGTHSDIRLGGQFNVPSISHLFFVEGGPKSIAKLDGEHGPLWIRHCPWITYSWLTMKTLETCLEHWRPVLPSPPALNSEFFSWFLSLNSVLLLNTYLCDHIISPLSTSSLHPLCSSHHHELFSLVSGQLRHKPGPLQLLGSFASSDTIQCLIPIPFPLNRNSLTKQEYCNVQSELLVVQFQNASSQIPVVFFYPF